MAYSPRDICKDCIHLGRVTDPYTPANRIHLYVHHFKTRGPALTLRAIDPLTGLSYPTWSGTVAQARFALAKWEDIQQKLDYFLIDDQHVNPNLLQRQTIDHFIHRAFHPFTKESQLRNVHY